MPTPDDKQGEGQQPQDKPAVSFKTEGDFLHAARERTKKDTAEAVSAARASLLKEIGVENPDDVDLPKLAELVKGSKRQVSELERAQRELAGRDKSLSELTAEVSHLREFKATTTKRDAIAAAASKDVNPEMLDMVSAFLLPKLVIDDKGNVTGSDGAKLSELVSDLLKDRPLLKRDAFKPGAGTSPVPPVAPPSGGKGNGTTQKKPFGAAVMDELKGKGIDPDKLLNG